MLDELSAPVHQHTAEDKGYDSYGYVGESHQEQGRVAEREPGCVREWDGQVQVNDSEQHRESHCTDKLVFTK